MSDAVATQAGDLGDAVPAVVVVSGSGAVTQQQPPITPPPPEYNPFGTQPTPVARRAIEVPTAILRPCCLRCARRLDEDIETPLDCCRTAMSKNCRYCTKLKKNCDLIPAQFFKVVNDLILRRRGIAALPLDAPLRSVRLASLKRRVKLFDKRVTRYMTRAKRQGTASRPKDVTTVAVMQLEVFREILEELRTANDLRRAAAGCPPVREEAFEFDAPSDSEASDGVYLSGDEADDDENDDDEVMGDAAA